MHSSWQDFLQSEFVKPYYLELQKFLNQEYSTKPIYPTKEQIFAAFETDLSQIKVVILGQDPYHEPNQAHGLAFSVQENIKLPPSLINIFKEISTEFSKEMPSSGNLKRWQDQGVLLLNNVLTVEAHNAGSHRKKGWETFTENCVKYLNETRPHLVFLLWGSDARSKAKLIDKQKHYVLESAHPSPLSAYRGFFDNNHFKLCNEKLAEWGLSEIDW